MKQATKTPKFKLARRHRVPIFFFLSALVTWPILAEREVFETVYEFSRTHEHLELDELLLLIVNLTFALLFTAVFQWRKLNHLMKQRELQRRRAERNARHDPLTGLMNRRAFSDQMNKIPTHQPKDNGRIIAMIDLDRFKPVNDLHGHFAGDLTLQTVAERLVAEAGTDAQTARLGGDEFAIIFGPDITRISTERIARNILHRIEQAVPYNDGRIFVGCSIGLYEWEDALPASEAVRRADKALYMAKNLGKGRYSWYDAELDHRSHERAEIEADLREAIKQQSIEPWFQPIIEIESRKLTGFEVLARWKHKTRGQISPGVFIEIAEDTGQIGELGMCLLRQACTAARHWDPELSISFNISPLQFHDPRLVEQIELILKDCDFDAKRLTIEITESSVINDFTVARTKLDALKALGVAVALDDFGTGYSSLASLRQLPFDRIKIDRSFITNISNEPQNQKIVNGIMALARGLELDVTAEGIETRDDLGYLETLECSLGQGFLFEKALPADQISWLLQTKWSNGQIEDSQPEDTVSGSEPRKHA